MSELKSDYMTELKINSKRLKTLLIQCGYLRCDSDICKVDISEILNRKENKMSIRINPDTEYAYTVKKQIKANGGYCPCRLEKNIDTKCMCKEFREMDEGMCHCGLYIKENN